MPRPTPATPPDTSATTPDTRCPEIPAANHKHSSSERPIKPCPSFPLLPHITGRWAKKIKGKLHYFGTGADEAFKLYQQQKDDLAAGRTPKPPADYRLTVKDMVNLCLTVKETKVESGELDLRARLRTLRLASWAR